MLSIKSHAKSASRQSFCARRFVSIAPKAVPNETPEQAFARRLRETEQYSERVKYVNNKKELEKVSDS